MITLTDYWMGRDRLYPLAMSPDIERNAARLLEVVNLFVTRAKAAGVVFVANSQTGSLVSSGWRPPVVNGSTPGASRTSLHMTGRAIDLFDPEGRIDAWTFGTQGLALLEELGLWLEHPDATPRWCHLQDRPPGSGRRVFRP